MRLRGLTGNRGLKTETILLLMVAPFVAFILVFNYMPLLGWYMAFVDYSPGLPLSQTPFMGLKYFRDLFSISSDFLTVMRNTFVMSFLGILCSPLPVVLAVMINELRNMRLKRLVQTATSLPNFTSWIIVYSLAFSFFSIDDGVLNNILIKTGLISKPTNLLGDSNIVWYFQTLLGVWKTIGWNAIIYIGAISGIEPELYEAARVDGAGRLRQIWHITVPGVLPTYVVLLFLSVGWMLNGTSFEQVYVFHNPLVHGKIQTLDYYVYSVGLRNFKFSLSTAVGIFKTVVSVVLLAVTGFISKKLVGRSII